MERPNQIPVGSHIVERSCKNCGPMYVGNLPKQSRIACICILDYDDRHQGRRNIFTEQKAAIEKGATIRDCIDMGGANVQSIRSAELIMKYKEPERPTEKRHVHLVTDAAATMPTGTYRLGDKQWCAPTYHSEIFFFNF